MSEKPNVPTPALKASAFALLAALSIAGVAAMAVRFAQGLRVTNMTQLVPWGLWVALYIYMIGLSAGSFLLSTLAYVFGVKRFETVGPLALVQALVCLLLGMLLVFVDLGHPERFLNVFIYWNPTSILAWECFFYTAYAAIIVVELYLLLKPPLAERARAGGPLAGLSRILSLGGRVPDDAWRARARRWVKTLGIIGIPVAIGVHGGTGAIFAVVKSRPNWYTGLFPIVFLVSALASGGALLTFLAALTSRLPIARKRALVQGLARLTLGIVALDLLLVASEALVTLYGGIPTHITGWLLTLSGPYWWVFWFIQLGLGAVLPILIVTHPRAGRSIPWLGAAGLMVVLGVIGVRLNIVIPPLIAPEFPSLPDAYHHARFAWGYFPSANEWLAGLGGLALAGWFIMLFHAILPLHAAEEAQAEEPVSVIASEEVRA